MIKSLRNGHWQNQDWTGPDRINKTDRINNKLPAKSRHIKSLGHQLTLPTFAGVLCEKSYTR